MIESKKCEACKETVRGSEMEEMKMVTVTDGKRRLYSESELCRECFEDRIERNIPILWKPIEAILSFGRQRIRSFAIMN